MEIDSSAPVSAEASTCIAASPEVVWNVMADVEGWPRWNPDVARVDLRGPLAPGTGFRWKAGGLPITSTLQQVEAPRRLGWTGRAPGVRAVHVWRFEAAEGGTRVETAESFGGPLARLLPGMMRRMLASSLEQGLAALKAEAERRAAA